MMSNEGEKQIQKAIQRWENEGGAIPSDDRSDDNCRDDEKEPAAGTLRAARG